MVLHFIHVARHITTLLSSIISHDEFIVYMPVGIDLFKAFLHTVHTV